MLSRERHRAVRRWALSGVAWVAGLACLPTASAHPGHDDGVHVDPIYTLVLVAGLAMLAGSFLLFTREDPDGSRWEIPVALTGIILLVIGASGWL